MKEIQQLRRIAVMLGVSGTVTPLAETRLYKGGYGFVILQAYVPVTQNRSRTTRPLCTVFRTTIDKFGNRKQFNNDKQFNKDIYNMLYVDDAEIENAKYMVFECPLPKAFTDTVGELELVFTYSEVNDDNKAVVRLASGIYRTTIADSEVSDGDTVNPVGGELARLNDLTVKLESMEDSVDALLQPPDCSDANKVGTPNVGLTVDGRLKFSNLKGYDALVCSLILKSQELPEFYREHGVEISAENFSRAPLPGDVFIMPFEQTDTAAYNGSWRIISVTEALAECELVDFVNITEPIKDYADNLYEHVARERTRAEAAEQQLGNRIDENKSDMQDLQQSVEKIESYVPSTVSKENQLTDEAFVNSSINNMAAFYITSTAGGEAFPTRTSLLNASTYYFAGQPRTPTKNDYAIVLQDESQPKSVDGKYPTTRYMFDGTQWDFQYVVNNTSLTQAQVDAINSGITKGLVMQIGENKSGLAEEKTAREDADANLQEQIDAIGAAGVTSVNGETGAVSITPENIGAVDKAGDTISGLLTAEGGIAFAGSQGLPQSAGPKYFITMTAFADADNPGRLHWSNAGDMQTALGVTGKLPKSGGTMTGAIISAVDGNGFISHNDEFNFCSNLAASIVTINYRGANGKTISCYEFHDGTGNGGLADIKAKDIYDNGQRVYSPNNSPTKVAKVNDSYVYNYGTKSIVAGTIYNLSTLYNNITAKTEFIGGIVKVGSMVGYVIDTTQFIALTNANLSPGTVIYFYYYTIG